MMINLMIREKMIVINVINFKSKYEIELVVVKEIVMMKVQLNLMIFKN